MTFKTETPAFTPALTPALTPAFTPASTPALIQPCYSPRFDRALAIVADAFRGQRRKGCAVPSLSHLLCVAGYAAQFGADEDQQIAALLHDYLEDVPELGATPGARVAMLRAEFGDEVVRLVQDLSDCTTSPKPPWRPRKLAYLERLKTASVGVKLVATADKLHNATTMLWDLRCVGAALWTRFSASKEDTLWLYRGSVDALATGWQHLAIDLLRACVDELHARAQQDA